MSDAHLLYRDRKVLSSGAIVEIVIWRLDHPDSERNHGFKYRLFYGRNGQRIVGYDNEKGKGTIDITGIVKNRMCSQRWITSLRTSIPM
uniref:Uncharacterized protein n=1 Tax=Leptospirillum ferrodiazotrophum TaxID=412449 RepID=C6I0D7_9BACT|nr:MAG: hypothetical protein UBAL3_95680029 [Leptospirillum ferrodiazotrophum]